MLLYHSKPEAHIKPWEIMKAGVPLLCIGADWDIYPKENIPVSIAKNTAESIAGFLIRLYQDEALHKHEKNKGLDFTIGQDVKNTAEALRKIITDAL